MDINTRKAARKFRRDCKAYTKRMTKDQETARKCLVDLGIYDKEGNLNPINTIKGLKNA